MKISSTHGRNVLTLMTGTAFAQAIPVLISPILTRLYTPADFGLFALYTSVVGMLTIFLTIRYEQAIMLPKKETDALAVLGLSLLLSCFVSLGSFFLILIWHKEIVGLLGNPDISMWLYVVPFSALLSGIYQTLSYWSNRKKQYKVLSASKVAQSSASSALSVGMGMFKSSQGGLILGNILGQAVATMTLLFPFWSKNGPALMQIKKSRMLAVARKYSKFPRLDFPATILGWLRVMGIMILIGHYYSASALGQFSLAWKIIQVPLILLGWAVGQVFFQQISILAKDMLYPVVKNFILQSMLISTPIFIGVYFLSEPFFVFVFGEPWRLAGQVASVMAIWELFVFTSIPVANVLLVLGKQEVTLIFSAIYTILLIGILVLFHDLGLVEVMRYISWAGSILLGVQMSITLWYTKIISRG